MRRFAPLKRLIAFLRDAQGGTAMIFALAFPALALLACGSIDLATVNGDRSAMQDAADATALAMAKQLGVSTAAGISARAQDFAAGQLGKVATNDAIVVTTTLSADNSSVTVTIDGHRNSFFANLLPPGGWKMHAQATASALGEMPLCVLSYGLAGGYNIHMTSSSRMTADKCLVQSNGDINVDNAAAMQAGLVEAAGKAHGSITPTAQTGAPTIPDPFASMSVSPPLLGLCNPLDLVYTVGVNVLSPGVHCGNITVKNGASVVLLPGEHYFEKGHLQMQQNSSLSGSDVVLVFDKSSQFGFSDSSSVSLSGRTSGPYAGFVIATTRQNTSTFAISSTSARKLEGAIYIPNATLMVDGVGNTVNQQSAWTVIVAQSLQLNGSADLVINSDYATSTVPVPGGVGNNYASARVELSK
jgi:Flp pilus assembly protein TadG